MKYILGIDVGGTKIASGLVDENLKVMDVTVSQTSQTDLLGQLFDLISTYDKFEAVGLGMPGQVLTDGTVIKLPNIKNFESANIKQILEKRFKLEATVINDAKAFALAEAIAGAGKKFDVVAGVVLGTGIGVGLISDKRVYFGKDGIAGEMEHIVLLDGKMLRDHRHNAGQFKTAAETKKYLKTILDTVVLSWNPDIIVLGGGWSKLSGMAEMANKLTVNVGGYKNKTPVKISKMANPGVLGAALSVLNQ
ncbi:MAG: ROK family protein [Candidatus Doudnabacteria bacterium]